MGTMVATMVAMTAHIGYRRTYWYWTCVIIFYVYRPVRKGHKTKAE